MPVAYALSDGFARGGRTVEQTQEATELQILVSPRVYPLEVIYRVCYQFTDQYYLWLEPLADEDICVHIAPKVGQSVPAQVRGEFGNALIDYAVRWSVAKDTRKVRDIIVSTALAEACKDALGEM
jgi:His-Xaa-Ser system protein HxsD